MTATTWKRKYGRVAADNTVKNDESGGVHKTLFLPLAKSLHYLRIHYL